MKNLGIVLELIKFLALGVQYVRKQIKARELEAAIKKATDTKDTSDLESLFNRKL